MGWLKRIGIGIWQVLTVIFGLVIWIMWDVWRRRRYKEKVDAVKDRTDADVAEIEQDVEESDGEALFKRAKDYIDD